MLPLEHTGAQHTVLTSLFALIIFYIQILSPVIMSLDE